MSMGGSIGDVGIGVQVDASDIGDQIEKQSRGPLGRAANNLSAALSKGLTDGFARTAVAAAAALVEPLTSRLQSGLSVAAQKVTQVFNAALKPAATGLQNFAAGFTDTKAAASALTGVMGSLGGVVGTALTPGINVVKNFAAGFRDSQAAASAFTGVAGKLGGIASRAWSTMSKGGEAFASGARKVFSSVASAAASTWSAISAGAGKAFRAAGTAMKDALTTTAKITGAAVGATLGTSLVKGFGRLEAIDTAQAKLAGLGITGAKLQKTMDAATAAVKGTAFGLGDAAAAAAQFSAAGVPVDQMQRSIKILASTASVAGTDLGEMTSVFAKVAATGKVNGEVLQQLSDKGVPALTFLAKQMGVTADKAADMVSDGKVSFATFQDAMEKNLGPAAAAMGQSFSGMLSNVGAALGRLGAAFQGPGFAAAKTLMPALMGLIDKVTAAVKPLADVIGKSLEPAMAKLAGWISKLNFSVTADGASSFLAALGPLLPALGAAMGLIGPLVSDIPILGKVFGGLTGPVGLAIGALVALTAIKPETLFAGFDSLASSLPGMVTKIANAAATLLPEMLSRIVENAGVFITGIIMVLQALVPAVLGAIPMVVAAFTTLLPRLITTITAFIPTLAMSAIDLFTGLITGLAAVIPQIIAALVSMLPLLSSALLAMVPALLNAAVDAFLAILQALATVAPQVIDALVNLLPPLLSTILDMLPSLLDAAMTAFMALVDGFLQIVPKLILQLVGMLPKLITTLVAMIPKLINTAITLFLALVDGLARALPQIISALVEILPRLVTALVNMIPTLISAAIQLFLAIVKALPKIIPALIEALVKLGPVMIDALIKLVPMLIGAGVDLIGGLIKGLWNAAGQIGSALLDIAKNAIGGFLSFLGIHSPSRLFAGFGENIGLGLVKGIQGMASAVDKSITDLIPPDVSGRVNVAATSLANGSEAAFRGHGAGTANDNRRYVEAGAVVVKVEAPDPYRAAQKVADKVAEEVTLG